MWGAVHNGRGRRLRPRPAVVAVVFGVGLLCHALLGGFPGRAEPIAAAEFIVGAVVIAHGLAHLWVTP